DRVGTGSRRRRRRRRGGAALLDPDLGRGNRNLRHRGRQDRGDQIFGSSRELSKFPAVFLRAAIDPVSDRRPRDGVWLLLSRAESGLAGRNLRETAADREKPRRADPPGHGGAPFLPALLGPPRGFGAPTGM